MFGAFQSRCLDEENPINWDHPQNKSMVSCWDVIGGTSFYGGAKLRDLCFTRNKRNNGTLTNGPTWSRNALRYDATDDYVILNNAATTHPTKPSLPISIEAVVNVNSFATNRPFFCNNYGANDYYGVLAYIASDGGVVSQFGSGGAPGPATRRSAVSGASKVTINTKTHILAVIRGATDSQIFVNGKDVGALTYSGTGGALAYDSVAGRIGTYNAVIADAGKLFFSGRIYSVRLYNIDVSSLSHLLCEESLLCNPNRYNWLSNRTYFLPAVAPAGFKPAWASQRSRIIGGGVA